jgi:hypothetical protein
MWYSLLGIDTMEFAIPISRFDPTHIRWGQPRIGPFRRIIPFGYEENSVTFNSLIVVLEPLRVSEIDFSKNQVILEESETMSFLSKLDQFQKIVATSITKYSRDWLSDTELIDPETQSPLQLWLKSRKLTLYLSADPESIPFFNESGPTILSDTTIKPGDLIRAVVKLHGISLQMSEANIWTGKSRIQHHVLQLYKVTP